MNTAIKDLDEVRALVQLYIEGSNGDSAKLRRAFHPEARMAGHLGDHHDDNGPIVEFIEWIDENPGLAGPNFQAVIRTIDLTADAGVVVLVESDWWGCDFVDYLSVARSDGGSGSDIWESNSCVPAREEVMMRLATSSSSKIAGSPTE